jgi:hypothetical protein
MKPTFPISDVTLRKVDTVRVVKNPVYADAFWQISQTEFGMQVAKVGSFYACNGNYVEYAPEEGATLASIELFLNGSVYGAILHQRNVMPLHGSSFVWQGRGIMLCGESGSGKSSLTAAFCLAGAEFLTDDVTPIVFADGKPAVVPLSDRIKLWDDALQQLSHAKDYLTPIRPGEEKYYFPMQKEMQENYPLHAVLILERTEADTFRTTNLEGVESFTALRNEVYRWEYLPAMPETEAGFFSQLLTLSRGVTVTRVFRPADAPIAETLEFLRSRIEK